MNIISAEIFSAVPGITALIGGAIWIGQISQQIKDMQKILHGEHGIVEKINSLNLTVKVLEERSCNAEKVLDSINVKIDKLVDRRLS